MLNAVTNNRLSLVPAVEKPAEIIPMKSTKAEPPAAVPISEKYLLTIKEASVYFNLGVKQLRKLAEENMTGFSIRNGSRYLIIRSKFEKFLEDTSSI